MHNNGNWRDRDEDMLWCDLEECNRKWELSWVVGGDLNMVLNSFERWEANSSKTYKEEFYDALDRLNLMKLPLLGGR